MSVPSDGPPFENFQETQTFVSLFYKKSSDVGKNRKSAMSNLLSE